MPRTWVSALLVLVALPLACTGEVIQASVDRHYFKVIGECPEVDETGCVYLTPPSDLQPPEEGGCWITGIGTFGKGQSRDSFGGNGMTMKDGSVRGEWQHVDHYDVTGTTNNGQNLFHGKVEYLHCERFPTLPGPEVPKAEPNFANWGGHGRFNGVDGYSFDVRAFDHSEGGIFSDRYAITVKDPDGNVVLEADGVPTNDVGTDSPSGRDTTCRHDDKISTEDLQWIKDLGCLSGGNFQIHPPNQGHPY